MESHQNGKVSGELELANALDVALRSVRRGAPPQRVAASWPEHAADLAPLLELAAVLDRAPAVRPRPEFRTVVRARLMTLLGRPRPSSRVSWLQRGLAAMFAALLGSSLLLSFAAQAAPGGPLYGLKRTAEEVNLAVAVDENRRADLLVTISEEREREARRVVATGSAEQSTLADREHAAAVERAVKALDCRSAGAPAEHRIALCQRLAHQYPSLQLARARAPEPARDAIERVLDLMPLPDGRSQQLAGAATPDAGGARVADASPAGFRGDTGAARVGQPTGTTAARAGVAPSAIQTAAPPVTPEPSAQPAASRSARTKGSPTLNPAIAAVLVPATDGHDALSAAAQSGGLAAAALVEGASRPSPAALTALRAQVMPLLREPPRPSIRRSPPAR